MRTSNCPSCGARVEFQSAASILAICEYCKSTLVRHDLNLENVGKMAELQLDGSPLQLRAEGKYRNTHFAVVGRIQLRFDQGLWNEWYLLFDDMRGGWLGESQGSYAVSFLTDVNDMLPRYQELRLGQPIKLGSQWYQVRDLQKALCIGGKESFHSVLGLATKRLWPIWQARRTASRHSITAKSNPWFLLASTWNLTTWNCQDCENLKDGEEEAKKEEEQWNGGIMG